MECFYGRRNIFSINDIPYCPATTDDIPEQIITWEEAKIIYKKHRIKGDLNSFKSNSFICFYIDDYKFDGVKGIWHDYKSALKVIKHFEGVITPDFSTYKDFPMPFKIYNTYRMRAFGYWLSRKNIKVINNVRWGAKETY